MKSTPVQTLPLLCALATAALATTAYCETPPAASSPTTKAPTSSAMAVTPKPTPTKITRETAQQMVNRVLQETSKLRQLSILRSVPSGVKTPSDVEKMIQGQMKEQLTTNELDSVELFMKQTGLAPANFDLRTYYVRMMGEQVAGYYDPKTKTFYTSNKVNPLQLETVMAHELTHALQDQHFGLLKMQDWPSHQSDAQTAMQALVEGDATLAMSRYMSANPMRMLGMMASSLKEGNGGKTLQEGPKAIRTGLEFPYVQGMTFCTMLYQTGGWAAISKAFSKLPQSTEQVLHYDKYLAHEAPVQVPMRDVTPLLGKGWTILDYDVNGESGMEQVLSEYLVDKEADQATKGAAGWGGDCYTVYRGPKKSALVVQDTVWDNVAEATEFRQAYAHRTNNRFKIKPQQRGALQVWNAAPKGVWMEQRGKRVVILEGTVSAFNPTPIFAKLWK